jgi:outer membrane lipoprotein carrier protein
VRLLASCLVLLVFPTHAGSHPPPSAAQSPTRPAIEALVRDLQANYDAVTDFTASFEHEYQGGLIRTSIVEHGTVVIKKPGKMLWRYTSAEDKLYVSDGSTFYAYFPFDRQVIATPVPSGDQASMPVLFLAGSGNLLEDFSAAYDEGPTDPGTWAIRLTPTRPEADYEWLVLRVDQTTLALAGLSTIDGQGGRSTYRFTDLVENQNPPDSVFVFEIPDGVDVMADDGAIR